MADLRSFLYVSVKVTLVTAEKTVLRFLFILTRLPSISLKEQDALIFHKIN